MNFKGCTAVITGASSGLGAEFARQLAPQAAALALVARREAELTALAEQLQRAHPALRIVAVPCDPSDADQRAMLPGHLSSLGFRVNVLINNAGLGDYGLFSDGAWHKIDLMMQVNMTALTHLTHLFLPDLKTAVPSGILNVSSLAGEMPLPDFAVYAATKAYVSRFSEALRLELKADRIAVTALCPGPVKTGFGVIAERPGESTPKMKTAYQTKERVVAAGLKALRKGRVRAFPGFVVRTTSLLVNALPMPMLRLILSRRPRRPRPSVYPSTFMKFSDYFVFFGAVTFLLGILGYVRSKSVASAFAGGVSGVLLVAAGFMALRQEQSSGLNWGYVTGLIVSVLLLGRFLPGFLKSKKIYPAGIMALLSILGIVAGILGLNQ